MTGKEVTISLNGWWRRDPNPPPGEFGLGGFHRYPVRNVSPLTRRVMRVGWEVSSESEAVGRSGAGIIREVEAESWSKPLAYWDDEGYALEASRARGTHGRGFGVGARLAHLSAAVRNLPPPTSDLLDAAHKNGLNDDIEVLGSTRLYKVRLGQACSRLDFTIL